MRLHRWDEGIVLPHEHTLSKPKADRIALLRACGSQQGQIFMLYPRPNRNTLPRPYSEPALTATDDYGVVNKLWEITDPSAIKAAQESLRDAKFYIADGHHRYETALAFRDECRAAADKPDPNAPYEFVMATLVDMSDPGPGRPADAPHRRQSQLVRPQQPSAISWRRHSRSNRNHHWRNCWRQ